MVKILDILKGMNAQMLYYPGCMLKNVMTTEQENYKKIFNTLGIDFVMLPNNEVCCGSPVINAGYRKDAKNLAKKNYDLFKKHNIIKIVTPCAGCYNMFKNEYPKLLREWDIEVEHATQTVLRELKFRRLKQYSGKEIVSYHDPCHLGRYCGIYDEPREIIKLLGGDLREMTHNKENSLCCGAGGGMRANYPDTAKKIAKKRMAEKPANAEFTLTPCGLCTANLKTADENVVEFSTWVLRRLT
jgi:heterodisulfide reductase subunit D